jgi:hypothetical protein
MSKRRDEIDEDLARADGQQPTSAKALQAQRNAIKEMAKRFPPNRGSGGKK